MSLNAYTYIYMYMSTRNITITEEAYEKLKIRKDERESFTDVIIRLTNKGDIMKFAGILSEKEADELEKNINDLWGGYDKRLENIKKRLSK